MELSGMPMEYNLISH